MVVHYVVENIKELVVECAGWNIAGDEIVRFLVVDKSQVQRMDMVLVSFGGLMIYQRLPAALPFGMYITQWYCGNDFPPLYPPVLPLLPIISPSPPSLSSISSFTSNSTLNCHSSFWSVLCMV